ncbi:Vi polysaccharide biosynthesis UDP-N-acetylglucosamine C-6 dehydrogenase TviB [Colwellia sp. RSH04]|uniref:Vi polysaccharide biosynthesis UDP-N-acetylglucosamine C-6 dehydrogenase TviB n=1 Tax=Colwellia sp. RSH04 TaxID=2305464 RepID=UPI000E58C0D5|nr:Vi polysaccharide biosynthesis UDP-N-acetylglucosamine C-6 dehydrogenase TviB [Colwellia sp. RSH04]RHW74888.1 Vi polysaccharide biosynthesis UDP-N-acetylglucosamine C-6 dehydrogenase TviB [Colwellia sp. RSH04]
MLSELLNKKIAVIGLGYVGLPLAVEFGKKYCTVGFDINAERINELKQGIERTLEVEASELKAASKLFYSDDVKDIKNCDYYIVTVPTPIDEHKQPDLSPLIKASEFLGSVIGEHATVIYESTVYPGATEEVCVPILEEYSGLKLNQSFYVGYSPERINPGDKTHRLPNIKKITSGSTEKVAGNIDLLYNSIILAGTYKASSIKVAEAAKVIENTQRDINIALINELSIIFERLDIDTLEVLEAAGTKWNFLPFRPGLVGGHCIGVDPYYLTHKAEAVGYHPEMILAGRRVNDGMGSYIVSQLIKGMLIKGIQIKGSKVLLMGFTFKENCPDLRNTKVIDIYKELLEYNIDVYVYDPLCSCKEANDEYGITITKELKVQFYDAVTLAVAHNEFIEMGAEGIKSLCKDEHIIYDLKSILNKNDVDMRL